MRLEDHVFIIASTIVFYLFIKYNNKEIPQKNLLFYTMLIPVIFYGYHLSFADNLISIEEVGVPAMSHASSDIMSDTYPLSSSSF